MILIIRRFILATRAGFRLLDDVRWTLSPSFLFHPGLRRRERNGELVRGTESARGTVRDAKSIDTSSLSDVRMPSTPFFTLTNGAACVYDTRREVLTRKRIRAFRYTLGISRRGSHAPSLVD